MRSSSVAVPSAIGTRRPARVGQPARRGARSSTPPSAISSFSLLIRCPALAAPPPRPVASNHDPRASHPSRQLTSSSCHAHRRNRCFSPAFPEQLDHHLRSSVQLDSAGLSISQTALIAKYRMDPSRWAPSHDREDCPGKELWEVWRMRSRVLQAGLPRTTLVSLLYLLYCCWLLAPLL
ncbi:hypothetical protein BV20DRAFT_372972 [Pilatotrama ljubarskyi]|nr:hypothetical protein BV20DRAFT_372972 [Pilatotrama ljubarskyi]